MRALLTAATLICLGTYVSTGTSAPIAAPAEIESHYTRQNVFGIPFVIPPARELAETPVEVHLFVSLDGGANWVKAGVAQPTQTQFDFRAPHDGEYWFSIRTIVRSGEMRPGKPDRPELKVTVDTIPPRFDLTATRGPSGEIKAEWKIADPNLRPKTLALEYQAAPNQQWSPIAIDPPSEAYQSTRSDSVTWVPTGDADQIRLRASVRDAAENVTSTETDVKVETAAADRGAPFAQPRPQGLEDRTTSYPPQPSPSRWPADRTNVPFNSALSPSAGVKPLEERFASAPQMPADFASSPRRDVSVMVPPANTSGGQQMAVSPALGSEFPPRRGQQEFPRGSELQDETARYQPTEAQPRGERPRMVNSKSFEMEYEVDSVGPSGIAKVEMWGTRDGGRTWTSFGTDSDNRSPMRVTVDGEGVYGFHIAVQSGNGLGGLPPISGDVPEIWVGVDLTKPDARLTAAEQGSADRAGELRIRWQAEDQALATRPVSLSFSSHASGPWYTVAAGLENTGSYGWQLDNRVPDRVYLRLEVRDEAGNVAQVETPEPISLDRARPAARIRTVRPITSAARGGLPGFLR